MDIGRIDSAGKAAMTDTFRSFVESLLTEWAIPREGITDEEYNRTLTRLLRTDMNRFQFQSARVILAEWCHRDLYRTAIK